MITTSYSTDALDADPQAALGTFPYPTAPAEAERLWRRRTLVQRINALLGMACVLLALAAIAVAILAACGTRPRIEMSDSMRPVVRAGDVLWMHRIHAHEAQPGDVVAFHDPSRNRTLVHRVRRIERHRPGRLVFVTRGDANEAVERWQVASEGTLGRYTGLRVPAVGHLAAALRGLPLVVVATLSSLLLAAITVRRIWRR